MAPKKELLNIIHLDDHQLFQDGLKLGLAKRLPGRYSIHPIQHPEPAIEYILQSLEDAAFIDLVITDFNHPGINGYEFSKKVKVIAKDYGVQIPVLSVSMVGSGNENISRGLHEGVYDLAITKNASFYELIGAIEILCHSQE
ncbi:MAG: response regulator transcription factor [Flavisolibacter sp.]|nr:response regulator transcription factor [Flavisolibacter sp.]